MSAGASNQITTGAPKRIRDTIASNIERPEAPTLLFTAFGKFSRNFA